MAIFRCKYLGGTPGNTIGRIGIVGSLAIIAAVAGIIHPLEAAAVVDARIRVQAAAGTYTIWFSREGLAFGGKLPGTAEHVTVATGSDALGQYQSTTFQWHKNAATLIGSIRSYLGRPCVLFSVQTTAPTPAADAVFPRLTRLPVMTYHFSYADRVMAPHTFKLAQTSTPWILFNAKRLTWIMSPASSAMVSQMTGNGVNLAADELNPGIRTVPAGFGHRTLLVAGKGIENTLDQWGRDLNKIRGVKRPGNQADVFLKYFGYWTDNGATYYYHYDKKLGYTGTLDKVYTYFKKHVVPLHYMQLDSWWYPKSDHFIDGGKLRAMNPQLPAQSWNVYGGIYRYHAAKELFPDGLAAFDTLIGGIPLGVHCRWIAHRSPYHRMYKITGIAAVDPRYWNHVATYLHSNGVKLFEHDWLNDIYKASPQLGNTLRAGNAFTNSMAAAMAKQGIDMQYCMPTSRFFLQGSRYANLTSIRVSDDHFMPARWNNDLYTSAYARALGIWPWVDVFNSPQTGNMLLAVLSAGPVGVGDRIGKASRKNVLRAVLPNGLIVKPDMPLVVTDQTILADAAGTHLPLTARTHSDAGDRADYLFVYRRKSDGANYSLHLPGTGPVFVYNWFKQTGRVARGDTDIRGQLKPLGWKYYVESPVLPCGIALLGDTSLFASMGKQRIATVHSGQHAMDIVVQAAPQETSVTISGYAKSKPKVLATRMCRVFSESFNRATGIFHICLARLFIPGIRRAVPVPHGRLHGVVLPVHANGQLSVRLTAN